MTEQAFESPYLRFAGTQSRRGEDFRGAYITVISQRNGLPCRLDPDEHELALLFDGQRTAAERLNEARARFNNALTPVDLERFTHTLTDAGLLWAGSDEALPVPPQTDAESRRLGDLGEDAAHAHGLPPSTSPGSLAGPGMSGPVAGSPMRARDAAERVDWELNPRPWLWLGRLFAAPVYSTTLLGLLWLATASILGGLWADQLEASTDFQRLLIWQNLAYVGIPAALLSNFIAHICRAAVIHRESGEIPRFGLNFIFGVIPRFMTDTEGPAERLPKRSRGRVLAASLTGNLLLFTLFLLGWFLSRQSTTMLPAVLITAGIFGLGNALLRINPLARTDGYYLLAFKLGVADLREQAVLTLLGRSERWGNRKPPPLGPVLLYGVLSLVFLIAVISLVLIFPARWLEAHYGGVAVALMLAALALYAFTMRRQFGDRRGDIGNLPMRSRLSRQSQALGQHWKIFVVLVIAALWPYTYEPGGRFKVLPLERADVSSETAGTVTTIRAAEGDWVEAGHVIAELDDLQWRSQVRQAEANVARIEADLSRARNGATGEELELARQQVRTAKTRLEAAQIEAERARNAHRRKAITSQERDRASANADVRVEELAEAQRQLELIESDTREEDIQALHAQLEAEQSTLEYAREQLARTRIHAPISGQVVAPDLRFSIGRYLEPGERLATIENNSKLDAELHIPEFAASHARLGATATLKSWMRPDQPYAGTVKAIAPSAEAGENGRIVRVLIEVSDADSDLRVDMSGQAKIEAETGPAIIAFSRALMRFVRVELWSWLP
ncbi:MAG: HlyD family efflux transporter periplasmic adaptor subunit [Oceanococcus sp.]|nr:MAG: HlyD family efflux transporter periplasmic adaptor subunit [Oceanococcus sp.]